MTEQDEDRTVYGGYGWIEQVEGTGYVAVSPGGAVAAPLPVSAQRSMVITDAAVRRELDDLQARETSGLESRQFAAKLAAQEPGHGGDFSLGGALQRAERRMAIEDVRSESAQRHALEAAYVPDGEERARDLRRQADSRAFWRQVDEEKDAMRARRERRRAALANLDDVIGHGFAEPGRQPW